MGDVSWSEDDRSQAHDIMADLSTALAAFDKKAYECFVHSDNMERNKKNLAAIQKVKIFKIRKYFMLYLRNTKSGNFKHSSKVFFDFFPPLCLNISPKQIHYFQNASNYVSFYF